MQVSSCGGKRVRLQHEYKCGKLNSGNKNWFNFQIVFKDGVGRFFLYLYNDEFKGN